MKTSLKLLLLHHLGDIPLHAEYYPDKCNATAGFVAHLLHKYFDGKSAKLARAKEVSGRISADWQDLVVEDLRGYCEEVKGLIPDDWRDVLVDADEEFAEYNPPRPSVSDEEIDDLIRNRGLTIDRVVDRVIQLNGIIGVGLTSLSAGVAKYIREHEGYKKG